MGLGLEKAPPRKNRRKSSEVEVVEGRLRKEKEKEEESLTPWESKSPGTEFDKHCYHLLEHGYD